MLCSDRQIRLQMLCCPGTKHLFTAAAFSPNVSVSSSAGRTSNSKLLRVIHSRDFRQYVMNSHTVYVHIKSALLVQSVTYSSAYDS